MTRSSGGSREGKAAESPSPRVGFLRLHATDDRGWVILGVGGGIVGCSAASGVPHPSHENLQVLSSVSWESWGDKALPN